jgi:beta-glucanase (GH16 family)
VVHEHRQHGSLRNVGDFTQWHTVSLEWTPGSLVFTLDGQPWATVTGSAVPNEPMALALQSQAWYCGHSWEACPDETTPPVVNLQIDWVVAYVPE